MAVFIKTYEGFLLTSYDALPPKGDWTIGWGHKLIEYSGNKNNPNITWTQKKADEMFVADSKKMVNTTFLPFLRNNDIWLTQQQFYAMLSLTYNFGQNVWGEGNCPTIQNFLIAGYYSKAALEKAYAIYMGDRQPAGLIARRNDEMQMFLFGDYKRDNNYTRP